MKDKEKEVSAEEKDLHTAEEAADTAKETGKKADKKKKEGKDTDTQTVSAQEYQALAEENAGLKDTLMRTMAEFDNFKKRSQKERETVFSDAVSVTVAGMLPVLDNLERAVAQDCDNGVEYKKGVEMTLAQFADCFEKLGVAAIPTDGGFDPNLHNAVMHVDDADKGEGEIVEVFQKGYMLGDKVIRHSMVKVAN